MSIPAMNPFTKPLSWVALAALTIASTTAQASALITNGDFETGDFTGWISGSFNPLSVGSSRLPGGGVYSAQGVWDGNGPGTISLAQDIGVLAVGSSLSFDYNAGANDIGNPPGSGDRVFSVSLSPFGGGTPITTFEVFRVLGGSLGSSQNGPTSLDLSAFAGQNVRVSFELTVPGRFTGIGDFELDNVTLTAAAVPEPAEYAAVTGLALGVFALVQRRRQAAGR
jgi:hypothetical protein